MDTVGQAAQAVEGDVAAVQTADATVGAVSAGAVDGAGAAVTSGQVIDTAAQGVADVANAAPGAGAGASADADQGTDQGDSDPVGEATEDGCAVESSADSLFGKVKSEIEGLVDLVDHEWDLLKAAIVKHL